MMAVIITMFTQNQQKNMNQEYGQIVLMVLYVLQLLTVLLAKVWTSIYILQMEVILTQEPSILIQHHLQEP